MMRRRTLGTTIFRLLVGAGLLCGTGSGEAADEGPHGALAPQAQLELLEKLGVAPAVPKPPALVDVALWNELAPADNATTPERIELGRKLYFDLHLSKDGTVACATCHDVAKGFTDQRPVSEGISDQLGRRNAPTTLNALFFQEFFLDGRAPSLEEQAKLPIVNPIEMGQPSGDAVVQAIAGDPAYQELFQKAYGRPPNYDDIGRAIAAFERTLIFLGSPFDRFLAGDSQAISEQAKQGWVLFNGKARCMSCHALNPSNPIGTDNRFHNIGVAARHQNFNALAKKALQTLAQTKGKAGLEAVDHLALETDMSELGRFMVTKDRSDIGGFKTLQLRNVGVTAAIHARRLAADAVGRRRPLQQGRRGESLPRRRHRAAGAHRERDRRGRRAALQHDGRPPEGRERPPAGGTARALAHAAAVPGQRAGMRKVLPFEERAAGGPGSGGR